MTKSKLIIHWIIYSLFLLSSILLFILLNNNITFLIFILILLIPFLSLLIIFINRLKLKITLNIKKDYMINESNNFRLVFNKFLFLIYFDYGINGLNMNLESLSIKDNNSLFLGFENKINIDFNYKVLGKYNLIIDEIYLEDIFKLFKFKIKYNLNEYFYLKDDFIKDFNKFENLKIEDDLIKNSNYYKNNLEVDEFKKYQEGDPVNLINWKISSKSEELFVKTSKSGINNNLIVILDTEIINFNNFNEYLSKYIELIKYLFNKNVQFDIGFFDFKKDTFIELKCENIEYIIKEIYENLYIKENKLDILNYYLNNSLSKKVIYLVSNKNFNQKGVIIIN